MSKAVIRDGRWVREDNEPLDPCELHQIHGQMTRIHAFADGVAELTHDKIEILSHILHVNPAQERAILRILKMNEETINSLI
jgi:Asp-tRNA(Asn)/Glu-tRNA(Gln) amidotransferase C subunit